MASHADAPRRTVVRLVVPAIIAGLLVAGCGAELDGAAVQPVSDQVATVASAGPAERSSDLSFRLVDGVLRARVRVTPGTEPAELMAASFAARIEGAQRRERGQRVDEIVLVGVRPDGSKVRDAELDMRVPAIIPSSSADARARLSRLAAAAAELGPSVGGVVSVRATRGAANAPWIEFVVDDPAALYSRTHDPTLMLFQRARIRPSAYVMVVRAPREGPSLVEYLLGPETGFATTGEVAALHRQHSRAWNEPGTVTGSRPAAHR